MLPVKLRQSAAVTVSEAALGARDKWVKFTGIASNNGVGEHAQWSDLYRGASGSGTPVIRCISTIWLSRMLPMRKLHRMPRRDGECRDGLTARVTDAEGKITAQAQQQTALATKVDKCQLPRR